MSSPTENEVRTHFTVILPVTFIVREHGEQILSVDMDKLTKLYPFLKDSNSHLTFKKCGLLTESKFPENDSNRLSREDKKELYSKHMNSGKFESRAALARHLNVSRAWVSMVLNS